MDINGLVYLLNQAGEALQLANQRIAELTEENRRLTAAADQANTDRGN